MREVRFAAFIFLGLILSFCLVLAQNRELSPTWKKWVEEEVNYIITPKEREIFLSLKTEREREAFQRAFWAIRDPTPGTPVNEFREEHYRRLKYADDVFGRGTVKLGRETDRGRIYIILGPPVDVQRFYETLSNLVPTELWQYYGDGSLGLPAAFYVVFFQDQNMGDYRLYSPSFDGPQRLIQGRAQERSDRYDAYIQIRETNSELAEASLSLIPGTGGDPSNSTGSLSSDMLIADINRIPEKKVKDEWAKAFARHGDIVSTDYSVNYIESNSVLFVHQESGKNYLHTIIEPYKLTLSQYEDKIYATLRLNVKVSASDGVMIHQEEKNIPVELSLQQFKVVERQLLAIGDIVPLIEGDFKIDLLLRNTNSKEFSSVEGTAAAPADGKAALSPILFISDEKTASEVGETIPFLFHGHQLYPDAKRMYSKTENMAFYLEIYNPSALSGGSKLRITIIDEAKVLADSEEPVQERAFLIQKIPLQDYPPGYYKVKATLSDAAEGEISTSSGEFIVSHVAYVPKPWQFNKTYPPLNHAYFAVIRAFQYLEMGKNDQAIQEIMPFHDPSNPNKEIAKVLARAYFQKKDYQMVVEVLDPLKSAQEFEIQELAGKSFFALKLYPKAIESFEMALTSSGEVIEIINLIGYSYLEMAENREALRYFERSLDLFADQPQIQKIVNKIKGDRKS
ncbi:MAG: GWxTD domain-containing protein [Planctomycetes bacterium]|nr:GWxTD domain-containing protein [Planctomycetota bacterium]